MPIPQVTDRIKEAPAVALRAVFAGIGQLLMAVDKIRAQMQEQAASSAAPGQHRPSAAQPSGGQANGASNVTVLRERATPATEPGAGPGGTEPDAATKSAAGPKAAGANAAAGPKAAAGAKTAAGPKASAGPKSAAGPKASAGPKAAAGPKSAAGTKLSAEGKPAGTKPAAGAAKPAKAKPATAPMKPAAGAKPAAAAAPAAPIPGYDDLSVASLRARLRGLDAAGVQALLDYEKANARRDDVITMFERRLSKIENEAS